MHSWIAIVILARRAIKCSAISSQAHLLRRKRLLSSSARSAVSRRLPRSTTRPSFLVAVYNGRQNDPITSDRYKLKHHSEKLVDSGAFLVSGNRSPNLYCASSHSLSPILHSLCWPADQGPNRLWICYGTVGLDNRRQRAVD
jgi:hypothetical protein